MSIVIQLFVKIVLNLAGKNHTYRAIRLIIGVAILRNIKWVCE
jgi:hypothetical protein